LAPWYGAGQNGHYVTGNNIVDSEAGCLKNHAQETAIKSMAVSLIGFIADDYGADYRVSLISHAGI